MEVGGRCSLASPQALAQALLTVLRSGSYMYLQGQFIFFCIFKALWLLLCVMISICCSQWKGDGVLSVKPLSTVPGRDPGAAGAPTDIEVASEKALRGRWWISLQVHRRWLSKIRITTSVITVIFLKTLKCFRCVKSLTCVISNSENTNPIFKMRKLRHRDSCDQKSQSTCCKWSSM